LSEYKEEVADYCQFVVSCDDAVAGDLAKKVFLEVPKALDGDVYKGRGLRYIIYDIAEKLCDAHRDAAQYGAWLTKVNVARLSSHERSILYFKEILHFTHKEIGEILGIEPNTVAQAYRRAKAKWQHP